METVGIVEFGFGGESEFCVHARNELGGGESSNLLVEQFDAVAGPGIIENGFGIGGQDGHHVVLLADGNHLPQIALHGTDIDAAAHVVDPVQDHHEGGMDLVDDRLSSGDVVARSAPADAGVVDLLARQGAHPGRIGGAVALVAQGDAVAEGRDDVQIIDAGVWILKPAAVSAAGESENQQGRQNHPSLRPIHCRHLPETLCVGEVSRSAQACPAAKPNRRRNEASPAGLSSFGDQNRSENASAMSSVPRWLG